MLRYAKKKPRIFILHDGSLGSVAHQELGRIAKNFQADLTVLKLSLPNRLQNLKLGHYTAASCFRLIIPRLFSKESKVLYLDSDIVFNGLDVCEIFETSNGSSGLLAVLDPFIAKGRTNQAQLAALQLRPERYFNSGVLLFETAKTPSNLLESFADWLRNFPKQVHPDQDFLNTIFTNDWQAIDEKFNFQITVYEQRLFMTPEDYAGRLMHFAGKLKPLGHLAPGFLPWYANLDFLGLSNGYLPSTSYRYLQTVPGRADTLVRLEAQPNTPSSLLANPAIADQ